MLAETLWLIGLGVLWVAAWMDWKGRRVSNRVWIYGLAIATPFLLAEAFGNPVALAWRLAGAALAGLVAWFLWRGGAFMAGDAKAVMVAGLLLSPVGYWSPEAAQFIPVLDALAACLLIAEAWRRLGRYNSTPFLVALAPLVTLVSITGGLLWWPFVWLGRFLEFAIQ